LPTCSGGVGGGGGIRRRGRRSDFVLPTVVYEVACGEWASISGVLQVV